jgi:hypothetical protein
MRTAYVRLVGKPVVTSVNARGRIDFSAQLKAGDPVKYGWNGGAVSTLSAYVSSQVAYITTTTAHGFSSSNSVRIFDIGTPFDGTYTITSTGTNTFTYPLAGKPNTATRVVGYAILNSKYDGTNGYTTTDLSGAVNNIGGTANVAITNSGTTNAAVTLSITGPMTAPAYIKNVTTGQTIRIVKNLRPATSTAAVTSDRARTAQVTTLTTTVAHKFLVGDTITVANVAVSSANGDKVITDTTSTSVSYLDVGKSITSAVLSSNLVTVIAPSHGFSTGNSVYIYGLGTPFDGTYTITVSDSSTFTYPKTHPNTDTIYEGYAILQFSTTLDTADFVLKTADTLQIDTYNTTVLYRGIPDSARSTLDADIDWIKLAPGANTILIEKQTGSPAAASIKHKSAWIG